MLKGATTYCPFGIYQWWLWNKKNQTWQISAPTSIESEIVEALKFDTISVHSVQQHLLGSYAIMFQQSTFSKISTFETMVLKQQIDLQSSITRVVQITNEESKETTLEIHGEFLDCLQIHFDRFNCEGNFVEQTRGVEAFSCRSFKAKLKTKKSTELPQITYQSQFSSTKQTYLGHIQKLVRRTCKYLTFVLNFFSLSQSLESTKIDF